MILSCEISPEVGDPGQTWQLYKVSGTNVPFIYCIHFQGSSWIQDGFCSSSHDILVPGRKERGEKSNAYSPSWVSSLEKRISESFTWQLLPPSHRALLVAREAESTGSQLVKARFSSVAVLFVCPFWGPGWRGRRYSREALPMAQARRTSRNTRGLLWFKLTTSLVPSYWPKQVPWPDPRARDRDMLSPMMRLWQGVGKICNHTASSVLSRASFYFLHCIFHNLKLLNLCICLLVMLRFHFHTVPNTFLFPFEFLCDSWVI